MFLAAIEEALGSYEAYSIRETGKTFHTDLAVAFFVQMAFRDAHFDCHFIHDLSQHNFQTPAESNIINAAPIPDCHFLSPCLQSCKFVCQNKANLLGLLLCT